MHRTIAVIALSLSAVQAQEFRPPEDLGSRNATFYSEGTRMPAAVFSLKSLGERKLPAIILYRGWSGVAAQLRRKFAKPPAGPAESLYRSNCASCHDTGVPRAPTRQALAAMSAELILGSLESGTMKSQGIALKPEERKSVAEFLAGRPVIEPAIIRAQGAGACPENSPLPADLLAGKNWIGWSPDLENTRHQVAAADIATPQIHSLRLKWAFGFPGAVTALAQPAIAGGRLFVGSQAGTVYSLDARSGCVYWPFRANARVRTAITVARIGNRHTAMFGDGKANVYAVDAFSGLLIWQTRVEDHAAALITGSPQLFNGRLYVPVSSWEEAYAVDPSYPCCSFRGSAVALDALTGNQIWKTCTIPETPRPTRISQSKVQLYGPSGAAVWSAPTIDRKRKVLYIATGDSYSDPAAEASDAVMALDLDNGRVLWKKQMTPGDAYNMSCQGPSPANCPEAKGPDFDFGSSPILVTLENGRRLLLAGQKSGFVHALDPDRNGAVLWRNRIGDGGTLGGIQWGPAADGKHVYAAVSDVRFKTVPDPSMPLGLRAELDARAGGGLFALRLEDGRVVWKADPPRCGGRAGCSPAQSAAVTLAAGVVLSGSLDGHIRAYSAADGRVLWDYDTVREFETVNGLRAKGGALDGPGPVVAGGMLFVNSGYSTFGGMPGNVLLAFSVEGK